MFSIGPLIACVQEVATPIRIKKKYPDMQEMCPGYPSQNQNDPLLQWSLIPALLLSGWALRENHLITFKLEQAVGNLSMI